MVWFPSNFSQDVESRATAGKIKHKIVCKDPRFNIAPVECLLYCGNAPLLVILYLLIRKQEILKVAFRSKI